MHTLRDTRYQGAIIRDHRILLIQHRENQLDRTYWVIPGGGRHESESETECILREIREETNLEVRVEKLLLDEPGLSHDVYKRLKTYLCHPVTGEAGPGIEPEPEAADVYSIIAAKWFDLKSRAAWDPNLLQDHITYPLLQRIRQELGYLERKPES
jgi:8-oxo-dGTP pyrophosphatase MutT (NUDIX family)